MVAAGAGPAGQSDQWNLRSHRRVFLELNNWQSTLSLVAEYSNFKKTSLQQDSIIIIIILVGKC